MNLKNKIPDSIPLFANELLIPYQPGEIVGYMTQTTVASGPFSDSDSEND